LDQARHHSGWSSPAPRLYPFFKIKYGICQTPELRSCARAVKIELGKSDARNSGRNLYVCICLQLLDFLFVGSFSIEDRRNIGY
jgi:hypothetical protein